MSRVRQAAKGFVGAPGCARSMVVIGSIASKFRSVGRRRRSPGWENGGRRAWACFLRRYEPDQVPRVCGRATLSARRRSPEAVFSCRDGTPARPWPLGETLGPRWLADGGVWIRLTRSRIQSSSSSTTCGPRPRCGARAGGPGRPARHAGVGPRAPRWRRSGRVASSAPWTTSVGIDRRSSAAATRRCSPNAAWANRTVDLCWFSGSAT